jgi:hypothetical protein
MFRLLSDPTSVDTHTHTNQETSFLTKGNLKGEVYGLVRINPPTTHSYSAAFFSLKDSAAMQMYNVTQSYTKYRIISQKQPAKKTKKKF